MVRQACTEPRRPIVANQVYQHYEYHQHMVVGSKHSQLAPGHIVARFAIAGTVEECRQQVRQLKESGVHQLAIIPHTSDPRDRQALVKTFAEEIMARI